MIITRKVARWALLLKREALGRTYGAQKRFEEASSHGVRAMLPYSGRIDDNIETDTDTVATDLHRISSCVALALPLPFSYYYRYYYPRAAHIAASLLNSNRRTLADNHEDKLLLMFARIVESQTTHFDSAASLIVTKPKKEQQDVHGGQEKENVVVGPIDKEVTVLAKSNRLNRQNALARFSA
ncbi:uncharacterized protein LOC108625859 [Ceratina calcarata]|uniref:Uncharacterized protein LOC108625859 n=1 Tax=Ceratina calcarata TaxID=156304 RepID=A0AAJ7J0B1_9HYME|nr:uncharacterized protein LOC108625859 [Ceratina calcarata]